MDVDSMPIWNDFPHKHLIPQSIVVRRSMQDGLDIVSFDYPTKGKGLDFVHFDMSEHDVVERLGLFLRYIEG